MAAMAGALVSLTKHPLSLSQSAPIAGSGVPELLSRAIAWLNQPFLYVLYATVLCLFLIRKKCIGIQALVAGFILGGTATELIRWYAGLRL